jgi:hypothetical protein
MRAFLGRLHLGLPALTPLSSSVLVAVLSPWLYLPHWSLPPLLLTPGTRYLKGFLLGF